LAACGGVETGAAIHLQLCMGGGRWVCGRFGFHGVEESLCQFCSQGINSISLQNRRRAESARLYFSNAKS
jgi:hypothetical protein